MSNQKHTKNTTDGSTKKDHTWTFWVLGFLALYGLTAFSILTTGFTLVSVVLVFIAALPVGLILLFLLSWLWIIPFYLRRNLYGLVTRRWGREGIAEIVSQEWYDWDGEDILEGFYVFQTSSGKEYQFKVNFQIHYPSQEESRLIRQVFGVGAQSSVYYLSRWPSIHYVDFALEPSKIAFWQRKRVT